MRALLGTIVAIGAVVAGAPPVAHADAPTMSVEVGVQSWADPGDHVVVRATVEADELFDGSVEVVSRTGAVVISDVQVAGGTSKTVMLVAPTGYDSLELDVRLYDGDELVVRRSVTLKPAEQVEIVGVLPALRTRAGELPETINLIGDTGKAVFDELTSEHLSLGAASLDVYDTIAATTADLRSLTDAQRSSLLAWVNRGGRLLLDDSGDLSALPTEWQPGRAGYALAGRGEVRLVDGAASQQSWAGIIQPSGSATSEYGEQFFGGEVFGAVEEDLARRAGIELPSLLPLMVPLLVYWALASIGVYVLLRVMRRLTLAWVAIPVLAAITAAGVLVYGNEWRATGKPAVSTFVEGYPGGSEAIASVLLFSRDGGTSTMTFPAGWQSDSEVASQFGLPVSAIAPTVVPRGDSSTLRVRLDAGQVTTANLTGPSTASPLAVTASLRDGDVVGEVRNEGAIPLRDVAVFGPGGADFIGDLQPGQTAEYSFDADPLPVGFSLADRVWRSAADPRAGDDDLVEFGIWSNAASTRVLYPSGMVRAAAWTDLLPAPVGADVTSVTVVNTLTHIEAATGPLPEGVARWSVVRSPFTRFGNGLDDQVYRYLLPPGALGPLVVETPAELDRVEFWSGSGWVRVDVEGRVAAVPPAALRDGVVLMRIPNDGMFFGFDQVPNIKGATA
ncbi:MAG TPA: hypothetical protein DCR14_08715 [Acidimicrobiaceae bacterium]|nr:hypothetical protein [Acidimicrobiaceae bacterium]